MFVKFLSLDKLFKISFTVSLYGVYIVSSKKNIGIFFTLYFSQNQLQVINAKNQKAVYNAAVYCYDDLLGKTDANGKLTFKTKCKKVEIFANNFEDKEVSVQKEMKVSLTPSKEKTGNIDKVILTDKSDAKSTKNSRRIQ